MINLHVNKSHKEENIVQRKKIFGLLGIVMIGCFIITGCGNEAELENNSTIVSFGDTEITADDLYNEIKEQYGISALVDLMDHALFDDKYETDEEETSTINSQIEQMKSQYDDDATFELALQQYLGVENEEELREMLSLEYKRNLAVEDYVKEHIEEDEIEQYYNDEVVGDMQVRHILITPDTNDDMTDEEQEQAEEDAKSEAERLIEELNNGADFEELAKEYSDDTGSKDDGGLIDYFNQDSNMDEAFLNASINLEVGEYTKEPVQSQYGYHIILKTDQKEKESLEDMEDSIRETLANDKLNDDATLRYEALMSIREEAGMTFNDDVLKAKYDELMDQLIKNASASA